MSNFSKDEAGHANILMVTLLASVCLIVLTLGALRGNSTLAYVGGIGAAIFLLAQFVLVHQEIGNLWRRIEELEKKS